MPVYRIRGIKRVRGRSGDVYLYHRATGQRLREPEGSPAFIAEVAALERETGANKASPDPAGGRKPGTWGWLAALYRASPEWRGLAERTRDDYRRALDHLALMDDIPLAEMTTPALLRLRDRIAERHTWSRANRALTTISLVWAWGLPRDHTPAGPNPVLAVPRIRRPRDLARANRPWTEGELAAVLAAAPPGVRAAIALGAYTGAREADVLAMTWGQIDASGAPPGLRYRQGKTGTELWIPIHPALAAVLTDTPRRAAVIVTGERGRSGTHPPYSRDGFRTVWGRLRDRLEADGQVGEGLTFHGLRHTVATRLADAGADAETIRAITGHADAGMTRRYTRTADQRRRAIKAMEMLQGEGEQGGNKPESLENTGGQNGKQGQRP